MVIAIDNMQNEAQATASMSNEDYSSRNITFGETDPDTFGDFAGTFGNPYKFNNETQATGTLTNEAQA